MKWEYDIVVIGTGIFGRGDLQRAGKDGWELVSVDQGTAYCKRPVEDKQVSQPVTKEAGDTGVVLVRCRNCGSAIRDCYCGLPRSPSPHGEGRYCSLCGKSKTGPMRCGCVS